MDRSVREAVAQAAASLLTPRAAAVNAVLGWSGEPATLVEAAELAGVSRETVRRDRDRVARTLGDLPQLAEAAELLVELLNDVESREFGALAAAAAARGLLEEPSALAAVMTTLTATGHLPTVVWSLSPGAGTLEVDPAAGLRGATRALLTNGLPHEIQTPAQIAALEGLVDEGQARWLSTGPPPWAGLAAAQAAVSPGGRAIRRLVTMTGPLTWADLLAGWSRAAGKPPYEPLPLRTDVLDAWAAHVPGLHLDAPGGPLGAVGPAVPLDRTSQFLLTTLGQAPAGLSRPELLDAGESAGLRRSGLAAALSYHPALTSTKRGHWALRTGAHALPTRAAVNESELAAVRAAPARHRRPKPTTFTWSADGELVLEFSVPSGPSPVVAVPRAVAAVLDGARLRVRAPDGTAPAEMVVRDARAWGFGPAVSHLGLRPGDRAVLTCDLVAGAVTVTPRQTKEGTQ